MENSGFKVMKRQLEEEGIYVNTRLNWYDSLKKLTRIFYRAAGCCIADEDQNVDGISRLSDGINIMGNLEDMNEGVAAKRNLGGTWNIWRVQFHQGMGTWLKSEFFVPSARNVSFETALMQVRESNKIVQESTPRRCNSCGQNLPESGRGVLLKPEAA